MISYRVSCITLKVGWCDIVVVTVHAPSEDKDDDVKKYAEIEQLFYKLPVYRMKILLGDFNPKVRRENIFPANTKELKRASRK